MANTITIVMSPWFIFGECFWVINVEGRAARCRMARTITITILFVVNVDHWIIAWLLFFPSGNVPGHYSFRTKKLIQFVEYHSISSNQFSFPAYSQLSTNCQTTTFYPIITPYVTVSFTLYYYYVRLQTMYRTCSIPTWSESSNTALASPSVPQWSLQYTILNRKYPTFSWRLLVPLIKSQSVRGWGARVELLKAASSLTKI